MVYTLENEQLRVSVKDYGAELCGILWKTTGTELLWQSDPAIWSGQAPILFPIVGRLWKDRYRLEEKEYILVKHGFARKSLFTPIKTGQNSLCFELCASEQTRAGYPFAFRLLIHYELAGDVLSVRYEVINEDSREIYFSLGAHPGFRCQMGDRLVFDQPERLVSERINEEGCLTDELEEISQDGVITVTPTIFKKDVLIFARPQSKTVTLKKAGTEPDVRMEFGKAGFLGIWAKPGAPYVCIEPWAGVNDPIGYEGDFRDRRGTVCLPVGERYCFNFNIKVIGK